MGSLFFFNDTATTEIYTLSLHDALPIFTGHRSLESLANRLLCLANRGNRINTLTADVACSLRSEEHTSELQSRQYIVCRLLLEKKKNYDSAVSPSSPIRLFSSRTYHV